MEMELKTSAQRRAFAGPAIFMAPRSKGYLEIVSRFHIPAVTGAHARARAKRHCRRWRILLQFSCCNLALLPCLLIRIGKIDLRQTWHLLQSVSRMAFAKLVLLNVLLIFISTEKWRAVDASLRSLSDSIPSRSTAFALTSAGMALGLVLPVQLGMAVARTMGTCFYGTPFKRGTAGTLLEQSFDVVIICFLAVASGVTWFFHGAAITWTACAV
jgi:hypothetical protein